MKTSMGPRAVQAALVTFVAVVATACGGGGDGGDGSGAGSGGSFTPATPPSDVCGLLALTDVHAILPRARAGVPQQLPPDTADYWTRDCKWDVSDTSTESVELVLFGAKTPAGLQTVRIAAQSGTMNSPVTGLGDEAYYWEQDTSDNGLWAISGSFSVDVTAYFIDPFPTAEQLRPLVAKVIGELQ